jgi:uncharacterized protein YbjT (DUF2867 family)
MQSLTERYRLGTSGDRMMDSSGLVLVTGATGAQGGATARRLLARGRRVRFLARDPYSPAARALAASGAQAAQGDLGDAASIAAAVQGVAAVFSVQVPDVTGNDHERRHGFALVQAARAAGVSQFVHTSVAQTGRHTGFPGWNSGRWSNKYWTDKGDIEEAVRHAGFAHWTVLQPAFMMDNLARPKSGFMFPHLHQGELLTALRPDTQLHFIAAADVGAFAAAAIDDPARWAGARPRPLPGLGQCAGVDQRGRLCGRHPRGPISRHSIDAAGCLGRSPQRQHPDARAPLSPDPRSHPPKTSCRLSATSPLPSRSAPKTACASSR